MTRWLVDPIGSFFKVHWNIFCELSPSDRQRLYQEFRIAAEAALISALSSEWVNRLQQYGTHIWDLWVHYAGHVRYAAQLHRAQYPVSVPSTIGVANAASWTAWEQKAEELVREMYIQRLCEMTAGTS